MGISKRVASYRAFSTYANYALRSDQLDQFVGSGALAIALGIGLEVAQIANVTSLVLWSTVCLAVWVDYASCHKLSMLNCEGICCIDSQ
jgi:hypothetical protein